MRPVPVIAALSLLLTALVGCGEERAGDEHRTDDSGVQRTVVSTADAPTIVVVDAGGLPRRELRLTLEEGQVEASAMTMRQSQVITGLPRNEVPPVTMSFTTEVVDIAPDRIETTIQYDRPVVHAEGADPDVVDQVDQSLAPFDDLRAYAVLTDRGANLEMSVDIPDDLAGTAKTLLEQFAGQSAAMTVPFPDEAVGEGARWTATSDYELAGLGIRQRSTYTLDKLDGSEYAISVEIHQTYDAGSVEGFKVVDGTGDGGGSYQGSTTLISPTNGSVRSEGLLRGLVDGQQVTIGTNIRMNVQSGRS